MLITKTAVILAGGKGTRLKKVVNDRPKPMAQVRNRPFLDYLMSYWYQQGIKRFILLVGYDYLKIINHYGYSYKEASIEYSVEEKPLGTGGALLNLVKNSSLEDKFILLNGDSYLKANLNEIGIFHNEKKTDCILTLCRLNDTKRYMGCKIDNNKKLVNLNIHNEYEINNKILINGGVYLFSKSFFNDLTYNSLENLSLEDTILPNELNKKYIYGLETKEILIDIGVPEDYKKIQKLDFQ